MRVFSLGFLVFLVFSFFARWYYVCQIKNICGDEPVSTRPMTLSLKDGDNTILQDYEQFGFPDNSFAADISENNRDFLSKVADHLQQFPDKNIELTGRYLASEANAKSGIFENLGIARAAAIERELEKLGVDEDRITIAYEMVDGDMLNEPISFSLYAPVPDVYVKLEYKFTDNTFSDANFAFNSAIFKPGEQCILYADSVKTFLDENPDFILNIIGHTDNVGNEKYNYDLGLERAKNAAQYFRELGVKAEIDISSKGETQPIAPNAKPDGSDNTDGRQKNRRVNFKIIEKNLQ